MPKVPSIKEALEQIIAADQRETYRTIECDAAGNTMELIVVDGPCAKIARAALATLQFDGERLEAIARIICCGQKCLLENVEGGKGCLVKRPEGCRSLDRAKLILASGLVQDETKGK